MVLVIFIILLNFLIGCRAEGSPECNVIGSKSPSLRLKRHLFCEYDKSIRPVLQKGTAVNVTISLSPKFMDFIDRTSTFILHSWIFINWKDEHLTWKPNDFNEVNRMRVKSDEIWVPDFSVYNSGDMDRSQTGISDTICQITYTGTVICVSSIKYSTQCDTDFTYWPYDTQVCSIHMGSWTHTGEEISFDFRQRSINMLTFTPHKQWLIRNYTARKYSPKFNCCPNDTFPTLIVDFNLQRHSSMIHAVFVTPAVVLMIITLTVLWLDSRSVERISLAAVNFICHMLCIYDLHWLLPSNGSTPPYILLFYRDSMVLAMLAMIITSLLRKLQATKVSAPRWIVTTVTFVLSNRAGRFFLIGNTPDETMNIEGDLEESSEPEGNIISSKNQDDSWRKLAIIIEWLNFTITIFVYLLLILLFVPISDDKHKTSV
ncbi:PREDICTED: neuronal acetylcholine receptor subunit alpha-2-like [Ceratosolen solmsi marchali]|uniref:Neuronal acetylcholine receptor subunit alpha-2-like n=1 Tax=Ceratosolen solmsi marchali TaxID=326594 RepID=A0AAJ6YD74_9HYME|nr:PREDICTED: neuronal acetylcholine receptor subunit alpha-2-like [Ceratosolen solmsi marchali]